MIHKYNNLQHLLNMDLFYLFLTESQFIYKFGMTSKFSFQRLNSYSGCNKLQKLIIQYSVENGRKEEGDFKQFLKSKNIKIKYGKEYFYYEGDIKGLIIEYQQKQYLKDLNIKKKIKKRKE